MVTAIRSLSSVHGAEIWLLFWFLCVVIYMGGCFLIKNNRTKKGIRTVLIALLAAEIMIDLAWGAIYYHGGTYTNYGVGAIFGVLLWIPVLVITGFIVTRKNKDQRKQ